ncbi:MAG: hypothetical protein Ct9H300mP12_08890 [Acidimicrobiales bacterium]|nr:MAG: hypothetical protein Ct9H300mP12_08890 [Acidimicrobiales bacterium]
MFSLFGPEPVHGFPDGRWGDGGQPVPIIGYVAAPHVSQLAHDRRAVCVDPFSHRCQWVDDGSVAKFNWPHNDAESTETFDDPQSWSVHTAPGLLLVVSDIPVLGGPSTLYPGEWLLEKIRFRRAALPSRMGWGSGSFTGQKA